MPETFTGNTPDAELTRRINACDNYEKLRMVLKDSLVEKGVLLREADGNYVAVQVAQPEPAPQSQTGHYTKNICISLSADTPEELEQLKARVYEKFGKTV